MFGNWKSIIKRFKIYLNLEFVHYQNKRYKKLEKIGLGKPLYVVKEA